MPELNPLSNEQIFLKKIAENTGSDYNTGDVSEINPLTIDQILLKEIAANTAGQSGDITELEEKLSDTQDMISDAYDSTHTYNVGDYCIYENVLYKCKTANTTGTWDSSKWDAVAVATEIIQNRGLYFGDSINLADHDWWYGICFDHQYLAIFYPINIHESVPANKIHVGNLTTDATIYSITGAVSITGLSAVSLEKKSGGIYVLFRCTSNSDIPTGPVTTCLVLTISVY